MCLYFFPHSVHFSDKSTTFSDMHVNWYHTLIKILLNFWAVELSGENQAAPVPPDNHSEYRPSQLRGRIAHSDGDYIDGNADVTTIESEALLAFARLTLTSASNGAGIALA